MTIFSDIPFVASKNYSKYLLNAIELIITPTDFAYRVKRLIGICSVVFIALFCSNCKQSPDTSLPNSTVEIEETFLTEKVKDWQFGSSALTHAKEIVAFGPRPAESRELEMTRQYITKVMQLSGWEVKRQSFTANTPKGPMHFVNLYARFKAEGESIDSVWAKRHRSVLGAHIDTKKIPGINYLGAVDAAGSVGSLVEIADFLARYHHDIAQKLEIVFFDGEEAITETMSYGSNEVMRDGLYGSHYYALNRNRKRKFGIILDLLGHTNQKVMIPSDTPVALKSAYLKVVEHHQLKDRFGVARYPILDDHVPLTMFGTPSIDIIAEFSNNDGWWHQAGDTAEVLSEEKLADSLKVAIDLIYLLSK